MDAEQLADLAALLAEDTGRGDITSDAVVPEGTRALATITAGESGTIAGVEETAALAAASGLDVTTHVTDGGPVVAGQVVVELAGSARAILAVERTVLNLLSHLSGVATSTTRAVCAVREAHTGRRSEHPPRIAATRKTIPGLRRLQKKAVSTAGGDPHRSDLSDAVLIKDNHLILHNDIADVVRRARRFVGDEPIEIEVETLDDAITAARAGADTLLLDNFGAEGVAEMVTALVSAGLRDALQLEASGGITVDTVHEYADSGVDVISLGALTSSARHIDFSLHLSKDEEP